MTEAKLLVMKQDRQFQDQLMAAQTAKLMNVQGKCTERVIQSLECMAFVWDENTGKIPVEMTEESMTQFDQNMDAWGGVRPNGR